MSKAETIGPIERAFRECQVPLAAGGVSSFSQNRYLRTCEEFPQDSQQLIVHLEDDQASAVVVRRGRVSDSFSQRLGPGAAEAPASYGMFAYGVAERLQGRNAEQMVICGAPEHRERFRACLNGQENAVEFDSATASPLVSFSDPVAADTWREAAPLLGLLLEMDAAQETGINLVAPTRAIPPWMERWAFLTEPRKAIPLVIGLLIVTVVATLLTGRLKQRLYDGAVREAGAVTQDYAASQANLEILTRFQRERQPFLDYLLEISEIMPQGITLGNLKIDKKGAVFLSGKSNAYAVAEDFTARLNGSKYFRSAVTERMGTSRGSEVQFAIRCELKRKARR